MGSAVVDNVAVCFVYYVTPKNHCVMDTSRSTFIGSLIIALFVLFAMMLHLANQQSVGGFTTSTWVFLIGTGVLLVSTVHAVWTAYGGFAVPSSGSMPGDEV